MAYGIPEFPNYTGRPQDMHDFIELYNKIVGDYEGTLRAITELDIRLTEYESNMDRRILELQQVFIPTAVNNAVDSAMQVYKNDVNIRFNKIEERLRLLELDYEKEITALKESDSQLFKEIDNLRSLTQNSFTQLGIRINQLEIDLVNRIKLAEDNANNNLMIEVGKMNKYVDGIAKQLQSEIDSIKDMQDITSLEWLWSYGCCNGGISAGEWYMYFSTLTCEEWLKSRITCVDWYVHGRIIFRRFDGRTVILSPVSGNFVTPKQAIIELAQFLKVDGLTAEQYDSLGFTAEEYDYYRAKTYEYDWEGKEIFKDALRENN